MITCRLYRDGEVKEEAFDPARVSDLLEDESTRLWLDIEGPTEADLAMIQEEFSLHPLAIEDAKHREQRPKVDVFQDSFSVVLYGLALDERDELVESEMHAFAGARFLVTLRFSPAFDLTGVIERWDRQPELTSEGGGFLLYALLDEVVDGYFTVIDRYEDLADEIEDRVFAEEADPEVQQDIFRLKREVVAFRRLVIPLREVLDLVQEQPGFVTQVLGPYYRDVADHVIRVLEFTDNVRELLTAALEAQLSQVSNRLNVIMKQLTSWAAIVLVPTLIAGIYGMNFANMPELDWRFGYPMALGLMVASAAVLYRVFKKRDWL
ncbi:MAG: magnesium/cobalt transporter CorA [Actinobacteria bacterium]|nr:magnesium/cobalt transporter CorA [Actinomycetota bacterium]